MRPGHTDDELAAILDAVRRVETEVGAAWHPDDGPPPHVNTDPRAEIAYPVAEVVDEGGVAAAADLDALQVAFGALEARQLELCAQIATEARAAGRSINARAYPTVRRWTLARAVIAWAASGRSVDDLWFTVSMLATHQQCADADATLGGLISQFTIEQTERLYEAAGQMSARDDYPLLASTFGWEATDAQSVEALDEIDRLRRWKAEAIIVLSAWEDVWISAGKPGRLGQSKAAGVKSLFPQ